MDINYRKDNLNMKFKIGDKVKIKKGSNKIWQITEVAKNCEGEEVVACMIDTGPTGEVLKITWFEDELEFAEDKIENPRTKQQKEIDAWITDNISTGALDRFIMEQLKHYPGFKEFYGLDVIKAIEIVYNEITPEEQYDPYIWTVIVEKTLAILEPNKDKLFKIEFKDEFDGYIKEMIIGHKWIKCNLPESMEKICFSLSTNTHIDTCIDFEEDESVPCIITRIK